MGLGCGGLVHSLMGRIVLAVGSSWLLCELRRNVSLYILVTIPLINGNFLNQSVPIIPLPLIHGIRIHVQSETVLAEYVRFVRDCF